MKTKHNLSYEEAHELLLEKIIPLDETENISLDSANRRVLAEPINAVFDYPLFDNSAVDGYAVSCEQDAQQNSTLKVLKTISAGEFYEEEIPSGCAVRILTGAEVPKNTYAIIMQEDIEQDNNVIRVLSTAYQYQHIRKKGADFKAGERLIEKNEELNPAGLAIAASQNILQLKVYRKPKVSIITTGDELINPGEELQQGKIINTNLLMLKSLCETENVEIVTTESWKDDEELVKSNLSQIAKHSDIILISGGMSVGDKDYMPKTLNELGETFFHKVKIKPGKPFLFGKIHSAFVFGLPGNPAASFVCFEVFAREAIRKISGIKNYLHHWFELPYLNEHTIHERTEFVRCIIKNYKNHLALEKIHEQGSFGLWSLQSAHAIALLPKNQTHNPPSKVKFLMLKY